MTPVAHNSIQQPAWMRLSSVARVCNPCGSVASELICAHRTEPRIDTGFFIPNTDSASTQRAHGLQTRATKNGHPRGVRLGARRRSSARGFTLVEVLATIMLLAIVIPAFKEGITVATGLASSAKLRTEAAGLAESKLNEVLATGQWQNGQLSGDFGTDYPTFHWQATVISWPYDTTNAGLQEIDMEVTYRFRNSDQTVKLSSLTYVRADNTGTGSTGSSSSGSGALGGLP